MTIFELGALGEFFGSIAVLATLIYLAVQLKQSKELLAENRQIALGQMAQQSAGFNLEFQRYIGDPVRAELRTKVEAGEQVYNEKHLANFDKLSIAEKKQYRSIQAHFSIQIDNGLYQSSLGLIDETSRKGYERAVFQSMPYWDYYQSFVPSRLRRWCEEHEDEKETRNTDSV